MTSIKPEVTRFEQLAELVGEEKANKLCDQVGGQDMKIPRAGCKFSPFDSLFGKPLAAEVKAKFGGLVIYIPKQHGNACIARNAAIAAAYAQGATIAGLSERYDLTQRRVRDIVNQQSTD